MRVALDELMAAHGAPSGPSGGAGGDDPERWSGAADRFRRRYGEGQKPARPPAGLKTVASLRPSAALTAVYAGRLIGPVDEMHASVMHWVTAAYRQAEPATLTLAMDEPAWRTMTDAMKKLADRWIGRFDDMALALAGYFAKRVSRRTDEELRRILTEGGMMLSDWKLTPAQRDALGGIVQENVSLIRSIPREYLAKVEQDVMRSVAAGRDLKTLSDALQAHYGVTKRRAQDIALSQNQMATSALRKVRFLESGIKRAVLMHSSAGLHPRRTHLAAGREGLIFDVAKGWYDPEAIRLRGGGFQGRWIQPGELRHCRCSCRPVIPGLPIGRPKRGWGA